MLTLAVVPFTSMLMVLSVLELGFFVAFFYTVNGRLRICITACLLLKDVHVDFK